MPRASPLISAEDFLPDTPEPTVDELTRAAQTCQGCELYQQATQTVFGEGPADADTLLIGEQPGDAEDRAGHPFVGPAGQLLDRALSAAGIPRQRCYVTNAVKHFRWELRGRRRLHVKPGMAHIHACRPWLDAELAAIHPQLVVCLGAVAAQALLGAGFRITRQRGQILAQTGIAPAVMATVHPSSVLRMPDDETRRAAFESLVADLRVAAEARKRARR